jgi:hypothetical protein
MTNDEIQMTKEGRNPNVEEPTRPKNRLFDICASSLVIPSSFEFRHSTFVVLARPQLGHVARP